MNKTNETKVTKLAEVIKPKNDEQTFFTPLSAIVAVLALIYVIIEVPMALAGIAMIVSLIFTMGYIGKKAKSAVRKTAGKMLAAKDMQETTLVNMLTPSPRVEEEVGSRLSLYYYQNLCVFACDTNFCKREGVIMIDVTPFFMRTVTVKLKNVISAACGLSASTRQRV